MSLSRLSFFINLGLKHTGNVAMMAIVPLFYHLEMENLQICLEIIVNVKDSVDSDLTQMVLT